MDYYKLIEAIRVINERIEEIIHDDYFELSIRYLKRIHKYIFNDVLLEAGNFRTYMIHKAEIILHDRSVAYPDYHTIEEYLKISLNEEKKINYHSLTINEQIERIANFTKAIWEIHPFADGNTRTTSVFIIKYLQTMGYNIDNTIFKENAAFFRNALVKACYYNEKLGIHPDQKPLIHFFYKVLLNNDEELNDSELEIPELYRGRRRTLTNQNNNKKK